MIGYYFQKYMRLYSFKWHKNHCSHYIQAAAHSDKTIHISYHGPNLIHIKGDVNLNNEDNNMNYKNRFYQVIQIPDKFKKEDVKINIQNGLIRLIIKIPVFNANANSN